MKSLRVLIIDDDRAHGESLSDLLNSRGHEAYFAESLSDADWLLELFPFQLAILDYDMPGLDGVDTLSRLRALPGGRAARVIVVSASVGPEAIHRFAVLGVQDFLRKPVDIEGLVGVITALAKRAGWDEDLSDED